MGRAIKELGLRREDLVISTKIKSCGGGVNDTFLSRKHIIEGVRNSLKRLQVDYVDVIYCHRPDNETPLEETLKAMSYVIEQGWAFYWGTSMWPADRITKAIEICERKNLHKPIVEQCEYSQIVRDRFEKDYRRLFGESGYGGTIWSPLAGGILTGKYNDGNIPEGSRYSNASVDQDWQKYFGSGKKESTLKKLNALAVYAKELGYTQTQLSLAWAIANRDVSTCILGFSRTSQVAENLKALELYKKWNSEIEKKVREILDNEPEADPDWRTWGSQPQRRDQTVKFQ
jgi:aryl-alcohol dehydrogenase-like predicted oxidoreductase